MRTLMRAGLFSSALFLSCLFTQAQSLYFPPLTGNSWDTLHPSSLGWCEDKIDSLHVFLEDNHTKAFILLKDGKIVIEKYYGSFTQDSLWYWASAGKSVTSMLVGIAQQEGFLSIDDSSSKYLGKGWTSCTPAEEGLITVKNQLSMTSGLDDAVPDPHCTLSSCLQYLADAGTRWAYHNAPYTLLDSVIMNATGINFNSYFFTRLRNKCGMNGAFIPQGFNNLYVSNARSMARYGLMVLNHGKWDTTTVLSDTTYYHDMINTSNPHNLSYGYLWWLNGKSSFMLPQSQFVFNGSLNPDAPDDMFAAMGKNGQLLNIVPSMNFVFIRMGDPPGSNGNDISPVFNNEIWAKLQAAFCNSNAITEHETKGPVSIFPVPAAEVLHINFRQKSPNDFRICISDISGKLVYQSAFSNHINISFLRKGFYVIRFQNPYESYSYKFIKD